MAYCEASQPNLHLGLAEKQRSDAAMTLEETRIARSPRLSSALMQVWQWLRSDSTEACAMDQVRMNPVRGILRVMRTVDHSAGRPQAILKPTPYRSRAGA